MSTTSAPYEYDIDNPLVYRNEMGRYKTDRQLSFVRAVLARERMRILDVGGGGGRVAIPLAQLGHDVTVIDISAEALDLLRSRTGERVAVACSDFMSFAPAATFEVTVVIDTLKYVSEASVSEVFAKINSFLAPGGVFVIAEINQGSWRNRLSERLGRRGGLRYNIATADGYRRALAGAGFETMQEQGFLWMPLPFNSDSPLVRSFERVETALHLGKWVRQSPWLLIAARKVGAPRTV